MSLNETRTRALPEHILGYCYQAGYLTVYVNGSMPLALRTAQQDGHTDQEAWLVDEDLRHRPY